MIDRDSLFGILNITDVLELPAAVMSLLNGDVSIRDDKYRQLINAADGHLDKDWFQEIYESELAQRHQNKQDFTPSSVSMLLNEIVGAQTTYHEPTAGNGSILISAWWNKARKVFPWEWRSDLFKVDCWELSDRSVPLLLLNLSVRGIIGTVHHGDVLEQTEKARYRLTCEDGLSFSKITRVL